MVESQGPRQQSLGAQFDIKAFHNAGLLSGALPLEILERVIGEYIEQAKTTKPR